MWSVFCAFCVLFRVGDQGTGYGTDKGREGKTGAVPGAAKQKDKLFNNGIDLMFRLTLWVVSREQLKRVSNDLLCWVSAF